MLVQFSQTVFSRELQNQFKKDEEHLIVPSFPIEKFSHLPSAHLPYKVVSFMANTCLTPFLQAAHDLLASTPMIISETSCIHNLHALIVLFSGAAKAKQIAERLRYTNTLSLSVVLPSGKKWTYSVKCLFGGEFISKFRRDLSEEENTEDNRDKIADSYVQIIAGNFFNYMQPTVHECLSIKRRTPEETDQEISIQLRKAWEDLDYSFNKKTLLELRVDIHLNDRKTNENTSFVYYINVMMPCSYEDVTIKNYRTYHAFVIEQFFSQGRPYHRILSAWEKAISLSEFFQKRGYSDANEGCLTSSQISEYLKDFGSLICKSAVAVDVNAVREKLFGYASYGAPPITYFNENNVLGGISLRYEVCKIDPNDVIKNFREFIESEQFKKAQNT